MRREDAWFFCASGKHPVVKDFIRIGSDTPLMDLFIQWVEKGYQKVGGTRGDHSWRFFAKGPGGDEIACGLVRDSHDRVGRPFPLLIMGFGCLPGLERHWETLPRVFDTLWGRMESLSARNAYDLDELKGDLRGLPTPGLAGHGQAVTNAPEVPAPQDSMLCVPLSENQDHDDEIARLLAGARIRYQTMPDSVFIGGTYSRSFLVAFARALDTEDFVKLWGMS